MPSSHLILCCPLLHLPPIPPSIKVYSNESHQVARYWKYSASASVLPMNTQDWSPLEWTGWISLQSKRLSRVFCNTTVQKRQFFWCSTPHQTHLMSPHHKDLFSFFHTSLVPSKAPSNERKLLPAPHRAVCCRRDLPFIPLQKSVYENSKTWWAL